MENLNIRNMVLNLSVGQHKIHCPSFECRERKKKSLKTLSVKVDKDGAVFFCHHCDFSGSEFHEHKKEVVPMSVMKSIDEKDLTNNSLEWLSKRGISQKTAKRIGLKSVTNYILSLIHI